MHHCPLAIRRQRKPIRRLCRPVFRAWPFEFRFKGGRLVGCRERCDKMSEIGAGLFETEAMFRSASSYERLQVYSDSNSNLSSAEA